MGVIFSFIVISQVQRPIELKFSQVCYFMHWDTPTVKAKLWQLLIVSTAFKRNELHGRQLLGWFDLIYEKGV